MTRGDGRGPGDDRPLSFELDPAPYAEGSCLVATGNTRVLCTASVEETVPGWRAASGKGWVTSEYGMLPRATHTRNARERDGVKGRTQEIQRLIGRSLRGVVDLSALGPRTVLIDCDVIQADGGTRTAAITGGCVALALALARLKAEGVVASDPLLGLVAGVSVGLLGDAPCLDLDYQEDRDTRMDMNVVATGAGGLVEVQGTAEGAPVPPEAFTSLLQLALLGVEARVQGQRKALVAAGFPREGL
ncbi:MAG: ribonuclease PH [Dehalococcoidia bacterium]